MRSLRSVPTAARSSLAIASTLKPYLEKLIDGHELTAADSEDAWVQIMEGAQPEQVAALLCLLRMKGETATEIAGCVRGMKSVAVPVHVKGDLLDIVGTGGDGAHTINISTASVILAAAAGAKVCKFGNRSVSSLCGSADVLEALGISVELTPEQVAQCCEECGVAFMFAPNHYPAMKNVAPVRKALGVRTAFNILGPMTNPAGAQRVVIGVFDDKLMPLMAGALQEVCTSLCELGTKLLHLWVLNQGRAAIWISYTTLPLLIRVIEKQRNIVSWFVFTVPERRTKALFCFLYITCLVLHNTEVFWFAGLLGGARSCSKRACMHT